jgi:hypothetical protein
MKKPSKLICKLRIRNYVPSNKTDLTASFRSFFSSASILLFSLSSCVARLQHSIFEPKPTKDLQTLPTSARNLFYNNNYNCPLINRCKEFVK